MKVRKEAVAGSFYPSQSSGLLAELKSCTQSVETPVNAILAIMPHAGYVYSGNTAGAVAASVNVPNRVIILCPKHRSAGSRVAVSNVQWWQFPFGNVPVDAELCNKLVKTDNFVFDDSAHENEHSLEVEVPFLWYRNKEISITPIALGFHRLAELEVLGNTLAAAIGEIKEPVLIVASTDMSHQISAKQAERLDKMAINAILDLNPCQLYETVIANNISMCGVIPTVTALFAAKKLGAQTARLIQYTNSSAVNGDTSSVVGYAGIVVQ